MAKKSAPQSSGLAILETESLVAQNKIDKAQALLEEARSRTPRDVELCVKSAEMLRQQRRFNDARKLLDQAQKSLGDSVALRLERSQLLASQGGADLPKALGALAENSDSFSTADRRRLLEVLAQEANLLNDRTLVTDLWSRVAKLDPNDLEPKLRLLDLALKGKNKADIENQLNEIKRIEGADGSSEKYGEALYLIWQSVITTDLKGQAKLRSTARLLLEDLRSRRPDWPQIPRTLANLALADLAQPNLSDREKSHWQEEAAKLYLQAIDLGQRDLDIIRRATNLHYAEGRDKSKETESKKKLNQLWTKLSETTRAGSDLQRQLSVEAFRNRDNESALKLAQEAKAANPDDFRQTLFLVGMLVASQRQGDAEKELREAVRATPLDPARRVALVEFFTFTKQLENAEKAVLEAEAALKDMPLGAARCCEVLARAYKTAGQDDKNSEAWLEMAGRWYAAAQKARPKDLGVSRQYIDFLVRSGNMKTARKVLENMVGANLAEPEDCYKLALIYSNDRDWSDAHEQFKKLLEQTKKTGDPEVLKRRPDYIAQFIDELLKRYQSDQRQELLNEAQDLLAELKVLLPDAFNVVVLEARLFKAQNQIGKAIELIQVIAKRPDLSDPVSQLLAKLADQLGETKLAEKLLRQLVEKSDRPQNRLALALFLGRHGGVKEALDQCEPLWNATTNPEELVEGTLKVLSFPDGDRDKTQL
ncbi:MAG TPA: tetratricopeptide repeat protein, partial [Isosphaeraceae bacterium]|nr:tetratricopeptide repeat protein [Isosphaeraceae bacterium]